MKGLLVIPEMACAILRDVSPKTNTRRVIGTQPAPNFLGDPVRSMQLLENGRWAAFDDVGIACGAAEWRCEYVAGERRCLLTTWAVLPRLDNKRPTEIPLSDAEKFFWHAGTGEKPSWVSKSRPGRFLPNHLRHLMPVVEIVSVRAERVQDASISDILAEGVTYPVQNAGGDQVKPLLRVTGSFPPGDYLPELPDGRIDTAQISHETLLRAHWASLWDSINHERGFGWVSNPFVWRVEFRRVAS